MSIRSRSVSRDRSLHRWHSQKVNIPLSRNLLTRSKTQTTSNSKTTVRRDSTYDGTPGILSEADLADIALILPSARELRHHARAEHEMSWYAWWVSQQIANTPSLLSVFDSHDDGTELATHFVSTWHGLATFLCSSPGASIDDMLQHMVSEQLLPQPKGDESMRSTKSFIFTLIGWQTMLFRGDHGSCPSSLFAIADETDGYRGRAHMKLQYSQMCSREPLDKCLLHFGVLLPPKNYDLSGLTEHKSAFNQLKDVDATSLNASLLTNVGRFELIWTDSLACHLELDLANNRIYIFRYPSFCVASRAQDEKEEKPVRSPIYACAQPHAGTAMWAKSNEVSDLLDETLMSYRLLFGQDKRSRRLFRNLTPFAGLPVHAHDRVLHELCGRKRYSTSLGHVERKHWDLKHDFPILRSRLSTLAYEMSIRKPKTWTQLWSDKRDSAQWATFWTVLIFGFTSLCFSAIQIILQAVEVAKT